MRAMAEYQPCPDEICVGVIGEDGTCTICGALSKDLQSSAELDGRLPCTDGNCVGVAGSDGHCSECGAYIGMPEDGDTEELADEDRRPCPDGACIGVIGDDGRCTECGQLISDDGFENDADEDWVADTYGDDDDDLDDIDDERQPCPDGACIGIVDENGICSECGRSVHETD